MDFTCIEAAVADAQDPVHAELFRQHAVDTIFDMNIDGDKAYFKTEAGVLPGASIAMELFLYPFWTALEPWHAACARANPLLVTESVLEGGRDIFIGNTSFVDDLASQSMATPSDPLAILEARSSSDAVLDSSLASLGAVRNQDKEVALPQVPSGPGSHALLKFLLDADGPVHGHRSARYLGPYLSYDGGFNAEKKEKGSCCCYQLVVLHAFLHV